ncbi:unnamed protein product [Phytophthora fragariaefolia]|uniref:Unnamed protein product n=1 Tax=Phytophthora fragariaefolia TaxID=1490495 RepID=A0A9W6X2J4_9STRA|nr:unnamed protein product [Phytophthora fragariaefolia]
METDAVELASLSAAPPTRHLSTSAAEEEEEMPLLFMDELPRNFQQSAQLAAIATFMAYSDDEGTAEHDEVAPGVGKPRRPTRHKSTRAKRRQEPYAKPPTTAKEPKNRKNRDNAKAADTKELQLFLSMFHVS